MSEYTLEIVEGPEAGRRVAVTGPVEIGRDPEAGVKLLEDDLISRRHARLTPAPDGVIVEDLDSRNGTFVNGDEVNSPAHLHPGDQLLLGVTVLELRTQEQVAAKPTAVVRVPTGLTGVRRAGLTAARKAPEPFARVQETPDYVPEEEPGASTVRADSLYPLLDRATKRRARMAPLGIILLVAFVVMIYFATR